MTHEELEEKRRVFSWLRDHAYSIRIKEEINQLEKDLDVFMEEDK